MYFAMCRFNVREEKFEKFAEIPLPKGGPPRTRSFTQEEVGMVWREEMPRRIRLFFLLDFGTAARSRAIEEGASATWIGSGALSTTASRA
jgi:hypothetical protein